MVNIKTLLPELNRLVKDLDEALLARAAGDADIDAGLRQAFHAVTPGVGTFSQRAIRFAPRSCWLRISKNQTRDGAFARAYLQRKMRRDTIKGTKNQASRIPTCGSC